MEKGRGRLFLPARHKPKHQAPQEEGGRKAHTETGLFSPVGIVPFCRKRKGFLPIKLAVRGGGEEKRALPSRRMKCIRGGDLAQRERKRRRQQPGSTLPLVVASQHRIIAVEKKREKREGENPWLFTTPVKNRQKSSPIIESQKKKKEKHPPPQKKNRRRSGVVSNSSPKRKDPWPAAQSALLLRPPFKKRRPPHKEKKEEDSATNRRPSTSFLLGGKKRAFVPPPLHCPGVLRYPEEEERVQRRGRRARDLPQKQTFPRPTGREREGEPSPLPIPPTYPHLSSPKKKKKKGGGPQKPPTLYLYWKRGGTTSTTPFFLPSKRERLPCPALLLYPEISASAVTPSLPREEKIKVAVPATTYDQRGAFTSVTVTKKKGRRRFSSYRGDSAHSFPVSVKGRKKRKKEDRQARVRLAPGALWPGRGKKKGRRACVRKSFWPGKGGKDGAAATSSKEGGKSRPSL